MKERKQSKIGSRHMTNIIHTIFVPEEEIKRSSRSKNILILEEGIMEKCNELVLDKSLWESDLEFRKDFGVIIETLLKHSYPVVLSQEIPGHIIIRYNGKEEWGCSQPVWLTEDEKLSVQWEDE